MIPYKNTPFLFKELSGSSWYRRFLAEEFLIYLDHYPERKVIKDSKLNKKAYKDNYKIEQYHEEIIRYFLKNKDLDEKMPIEILKDLRRIRSSVFGSTNSFTDKIILQENRENLFYSTINNELQLEPELSEAENILFIPGRPEYFSRDLNLLKNRTKASIEVAYFNDPLIDGVREDQLKHLEKKRSLNLPLYSSGIEQLLKIQNSGVFIFTTNIWFYLEIFRKMKNFGFILNNSEWFSRGLLQYSYGSTNSNTGELADSGYSGILNKPKLSNGVIIKGIQRTPFPADVDISGIQYNTLSLSDFLGNKKPVPVLQAIAKRISVFNEQNRSFKAYNNLYKIVQGEISRTTLDDPEAVMVSYLFTDEQSVEAAPIFFNVNTPPESVKMKNTGVLSSFNYYFTENLVNYYNSTVPEKEKLPIKNFFIDYIFVKSGDTYFETLPLYNKAFLGCTEDGKLFAGHYPVERIEICLKNDKYSFSQNSINPDGDGASTGIYLPSSGRKYAGKGKKCIVTVQDQVIYQGQGPCRVPPFGAVIVVEYLTSEKLRIVSFKVFLKDLPYKKDRIKWLIGGFNLLVKKNNNLYKNMKTAEKSLEYEGWKTDASIETQETQLDPRERQPRTVLGRTTKGKLILAQFSGRTDVSRGANFSETVSFVINLLKNNESLDFLINFDGGASASITAYKDGNYSNFSLTAPSMSNPAGVERRLPAYFCLEQRN